MSLETRIPPYDCPSCGRRSLDRTASAAGEYRPKAGDITLCIRCGHALIFNADLTVRQPTAEERREIDADLDVALVRVYIARRGNSPAGHV